MDETASSRRAENGDRRGRRAEGEEPERRDRRPADDPEPRERQATWSRDDEIARSINAAVQDDDD